MNIIVCVKPVPDPEKYDLLTIDMKTKRLVREGIPTVINPSDKNALEEALRLKDAHGARVIVLSMAPPFSAGKIKQCLAMGADEGYLISDPSFGGADTFSTSYTLMKAIEKIGVQPDLILAGNESADGATAHVPVQLAKWLNLPHLTKVSILSANREQAVVRKKTESGSIDYAVTMPAVLAIERNTNKPRYTTAAGVVSIRKKKLSILTKIDLDVDEQMIGLVGSPTQPGELFVPEMKRSSTPIGGNPDQVAAKIIELIKQGGVAV